MVIRARGLFFIKTVVVTEANSKRSRYPRRESSALESWITVFARMTIFHDLGCLLPCKLAAIARNRIILANLSYATLFALLRNATCCFDY